MSNQRVMHDVRRALGRIASTSIDRPPAIDEPIVRLVHSDLGLAELFVRMARQNQMLVEQVRADEIVQQLAAWLRSHGCKRIALSAGGVVEKLGLLPALRAAGFDAQAWAALTLDDLYDYDAGVTDVRFAIAETGSLVIEGSHDHGRALSLVPPVHVAIVDPAKLLPDLLDLFEHLARDARPSNTVIITGPSKTADIEMNLVTGVHGPGVVHALLLQ